MTPSGEASRRMHEYDEPEPLIGGLVDLARWPSSS